MGFSFFVVEILLPVKEINGIDSKSDHWSEIGNALLRAKVGYDCIIFRLAKNDINLSTLNLAWPFRAT